MNILIFTIIGTAIGLYYRPSFLLIGQLDWVNVLTKGYFVGSISKFFSQSYIDESFYFVMQFTAGGFVTGLVITYFFIGKSKGRSGKSSKKNK